MALIDLVSIITPVLNRVKYLEGCIQSVLKQSYPYVEHIFVDGVSTDGTVEMLSSYQSKYPDRIRFISEPDKGAGDAWNKGLKMAKGDIFGWLGSDDLYEPDAIMTVADFFRSNPDAYFVFGDCNYINETGQIIGKYATSDFNLSKVVNQANPVPCPSAFYRREVVARIGWFDARGSDLDYWIRAGKVFQVCRISKTLSRFRVHKEAISGSPENLGPLLRVSHIISRRHGGNILSGYSRRYYKFVIIEGLRPILGFAYPFTKKVLTKFRRGKQVLHEEGVISFLEHALSFFLTLLFVYSVRYVYEYKLDDSRDIRLFACPVNNLALRTASCLEEFDGLLAEGLDLSWYDLGAQQCRERLSEGTILFCALVDGDCAHISWIQTRSKNHGGVYSFPIDYGREAAVGGTMTSPKYRRKGICSYVYYEIFRYLKEKDYSKAVFETHKYNIPAHRFHKKLRSKVLSRGSSLTLLSRFNFTWVKRSE